MPNRRVESFTAVRSMSHVDRTPAMLPWMLVIHLVGLLFCAGSSLANCVDTDAYEPNDSIQTATPLLSSQDAIGVILCPNGPPDFFRRDFVTDGQVLFHSTLVGIRISESLS